MQAIRATGVTVLALAFALAACSERARHDGEPGRDAQGRAAPTEATIRANAAVRERLALDDPRDFEDARRGLVAGAPELQVRDADGRLLWDLAQYRFVDGVAPPSVNPSLWRQARLNNLAGLFRVVDGVWQVRGFDLANMTLIRGASGWIVVDPLTSQETAAAAFAFARRHLGDAPVSAVVFTHSHVDHFGGALGVISAEEAARRAVPVVAPAGFLEEATSENLLLGPAMGRRAMYMYGSGLERTPRGHLDNGLGKAVAMGRIGILAPTVLVDRAAQEMSIDGVRFVFQNVPGSEAPAEMTFLLPELRAYCGADLFSHTMLNLYTLRGAKVRDALKWAGYIDEAIEQTVPRIDAYFGSHQWPVWGGERIAQFFRLHRDTYRYVHDQTVRMINAGMTPREIAEELVLPPALGSSLAIRGYYGTVRHNAKGVYQAYMGWYDGNPASLDPLPPQTAGERYVALMGGAQQVIAHAQAAYAKGEYRWVAELLGHLVFAEPGNGAAKALLADAYDQLGYQAESAPWRDVYLSAAHELRHGGPSEGVRPARAIDMLRHAPVERFFEAMAASLNGPDAQGRTLDVKLVFTDRGEESWLLSVHDAVLHHRRAPPSARTDATLRLTHGLFLRMMTGSARARDLLLSDDLSVEGSRVDLVRFFSLFDKAPGTFAIVTP